MVISTFLGGIFMVSVQIAAQNDRVMDASDSTIFVALLGLLILLGGVPSAALQTTFAQQAAGAVTEEKERELTAALHALLRVTFWCWLALAGVVIVFAGPVSAALDVRNPAALRVAMLAVLAVIWLPTFKGLLQGQHRFAPLGWLQIMEGALRLDIPCACVVAESGGDRGALGGVCRVLSDSRCGVVADARYLGREDLGPIFVEVMAEAGRSADAGDWGVHLHVQLGPGVHQESFFGSGSGEVI